MPAPALRPGAPRRLLLLPRRLLHHMTCSRPPLPCLSRLLRHRSAPCTPCKNITKGFHHQLRRLWSTVFVTPAAWVVLGVQPTTASVTALRAMAASAPLRRLLLGLHPPASPPVPSAGAGFSRILRSGAITPCHVRLVVVGASAARASVCTLALSLPVRTRAGPFGSQLVHLFLSASGAPLPSADWPRTL